MEGRCLAKQHPNPYPTKQNFRQRRQNKFCRRNAKPMEMGKWRLSRAQPDHDKEKQAEADRAIEQNLPDDGVFDQADAKTNS